jgi:hypothetical protein
VGNYKEVFQLQLIEIIQIRSASRPYLDLRKLF